MTITFHHLKMKVNGSGPYERKFNFLLRGGKIKSLLKIPYWKKFLRDLNSNFNFQHMNGSKKYTPEEKYSQKYTFS